MSDAVEGRAVEGRAVEGRVVYQRDPEWLPSRMVESATEFDWGHLPTDLRADLILWCARFRQWMEAQ